MDEAVTHRHVSLQDQVLDDVPQAVLEDAAQLVKANSITGNKMATVDVVYTMWANLKKTDGMEVGQVSFFNDKEVRKITTGKRSNEIVNRLNKTKREDHPDFQAEREQRDRGLREDKKKLQRDEQKRVKDEDKRKLEEAELRWDKSLLLNENQLVQPCYAFLNDAPHLSSHI